MQRLCVSDTIYLKEVRFFNLCGVKLISAKCNDNKRRQKALWASLK